MFSSAATLGQLTYDTFIGTANCGATSSCPIPQNASAFAPSCSSGALAICTVINPIVPTGIANGYARGEADETFYIMPTVSSPLTTPVAFESLLLANVAELGSQYNIARATATVNGYGLQVYKQPFGSGSDIHLVQGGYVNPTPIVFLPDGISIAALAEGNSSVGSSFDLYSESYTLVHTMHESQLGTASASATAETKVVSIPSGESAPSESLAIYVLNPDETLGELIYEEEEDPYAGYY